MVSYFVVSGKMSTFALYHFCGSLKKNMLKFCFVCR